MDIIDAKAGRIFTPPKSHHIDKRAADVADQGVGDDDTLMTTDQVGAWLGLSRQWLEIARHRGYGPPWIKTSPKRVRYLRGAVKAWLRSRTYTSTAQYAEDVKRLPVRPKQTNRFTRGN
jgi:predicted DNA-binding transcriptional regulator AlpA